MSFIPVETPKRCAFSDAYTKSQLQKWDMLKNSRYHLFRYTKYYHKMQAQELTRDLLNDPQVQAVLQVLRKGGSWEGLAGEVTDIEVEVVPASLTRMDIFDKLLTADPPIVRANGDIAKCMEDVREGFQVSDMLREMLLSEESENAELYSADERSQLLWRIFEHVCLGGACNQFEDKLEPYLDVAKRLYKEMLSVQKNAASSKPEVSSVVYRIKGITCASGPLFPAPSRNSFCYLAVDPLRRLVKLWYHARVPFW